MNTDNKREEFLRKAEEAELQAVNAGNAEVAMKWRGLAAGYRDLAELAKWDITRRPL